MIDHSKYREVISHDEFKEKYGHDILPSKMSLKNLPNVLVIDLDLYLEECSIEPRSSFNYVKSLLEIHASNKYKLYYIKRHIKLSHSNMSYLLYKNRNHTFKCISRCKTNGILIPDFYLTIKNDQSF